MYLQTLIHTICHNHCSCAKGCVYIRIKVQENSGPKHLDVNFILDSRLDPKLEVWFLEYGAVMFHIFIV